MAAPHTTEWFLFSSDACPDAGFHVVRFTGSEGLNQFFEFHISLVSINPDIEIDKLLAGKACFTIVRENGTPVKFKGILSRAVQGALFQGWTFYDVVLRPSVWVTTQYRYSGVMLNKTLPEYLEWLYQGDEFRIYQHEFHFSQEYAPKEFSMMYGESFADYARWLMEEQGVYSYFAENEDKVVYEDSPEFHRKSRGKVVYSPRTDLDGRHREEVVAEFSCSCGHMPREVIVRSYSWKDPNKVLVGKAPVSPTGIGYIYLPNEGAETQAEIDRIARLRAEQIRCESFRYTGRGAVPWMRPGVVFTLSSHYKQSFNQDYLITNVTHEGSQETLLSMALHLPLTAVDTHVFYHNTFSCIPATVPYRPARTVKRAKISGVIRAFIDSNGGDASRAEIDKYGRYKIVFPFDLNSTGCGHASAWVRQARELVGKDSGVSFPLVPGTEVLVSFIDGDPDRPVISGALANGETGSVTRSNATGISTAGGNKVIINDTNNNQGISLLTASGSGTAITSGSSDTSTTVADTIGTSASISMTSIANICSSIVSGWKALQITQSELPADQMFGLIGSEICKTVSGITDTVNKSKENPEAGLSISTDVFKTLSTILPLYSQAKQIIDNTIPYAYSVNTTENRVVTQQMTMPNMKKMLSCLLASFAFKVGVKVENIIHEYRNSNETDNIYYKTRKEKLIAKCLTTSIGTLLPELITSVIVPGVQANIIKRNGNSLGGILFDTHGNINLCGQKGISILSENDIYLSTLPLVFGSRRSIQMHKKGIDITNTRDQHKLLGFDSFNADTDADGAIIVRTMSYYAVCMDYYLNIFNNYNVQTKIFTIRCYDDENMVSYISMDKDGFLGHNKKICLYTSAQEENNSEITLNNSNVTMKHGKNSKLKIDNKGIEAMSGRTSVKIDDDFRVEDRGGTSKIAMNNHTGDIILEARTVYINDVTFSKNNFNAEEGHFLNLQNGDIKLI